MSLQRPVRDTLVAAIHLPCRIRPMPRPRKGKNGQMYTPMEVMKDMIHWLTKAEVTLPNEPMIFDLYIHFKEPEVNSPGFPITKFYGDEDNLRKAINDCMVHAGMLEDDCLCLGGETYKTFADSDYAWLLAYSVKDEVQVYDVDV